MKKLIVVTVLILGLLGSMGRAEEMENKTHATLSPEQCIKIADWSFYATFKTAIIHHVKLENTCDVAYKDVKVRVLYYSTSTSNYGTQVGQEVGILPVILPPNSKRIYLEGGHVLGSGSSLFYADNIQVLGAVPVSE